MPEVKARMVLAILAFFLFFIAQMNRVNINIAIVAMEDSYIGNWDAKVILLGAFYWCYSLIELPGTFIVRRYGCRKILAINLFVCGLTNFLFPFMYKYDPVWGIIIRAAQGLLVGVTWPAIAVMSAKWIPREERSKFTSTYQGSSVGSSMTNALGGVIIYNLGWSYIFYGTGILSLIWVAFWWYFVYDSPSEHPRISKDEREYIEKAITNTNKTNDTIPWQDIFSSKPFWGVFIATFGIMWFVITISMQLPTYLHSVHEVNIRTNGFLLCAPDILSYIFSLTFSIFIDKKIKNKSMSISNARKFAHIFSHVLPAVLLVFLSFYGSQSIIVAMILITTAVAAGGATSSGNLANIVDISPKNAGIIMGICKSMCIVPGVLSPIIVKYFITAEDPKNWLPVFSITSVILISTSIFYFTYGSGEIQFWDSNNDDDVEMIPMENKNLVQKYEEGLKNDIKKNTETNNLIINKRNPASNEEIGT